ncbi:MAG: helix-hairpin-helix domain-containing protein [Anaerovoracaceae bacterium]
MNNRKKVIIIIAIISLAIITLIGYLSDSGKGEIDDENIDQIFHEYDFQSLDGYGKENPYDDGDEYVIVDVSGAVEEPNVLTLPAGSRVYQAIEGAGGLKNSAETKDINLAAQLIDGTKIYIPTVEESKDANVDNGGSKAGFYGVNRDSSNGGGKININSANSDELQRLTGVGPSTADKILQYRKEYGKFNKIEDLMNISGIGEKTFQKLKDKICVE